MIYPPMAKLLEKVDSRYTLVIAVAKRARMLTNGAPKFTKFNSDKDVTIAIHEIAENVISYQRIKSARPAHENKVENSLENMVETSLNSSEDVI